MLSCFQLFVIWLDLGIKVDLVIHFLEESKFVGNVE